MRRNLQNNLKQRLWRTVALVTIIGLSLPPAPAMAYQMLDCGSQTYFDLHVEHAGHRAEADACTMDAATMVHEHKCCGDQCDGCVCVVCPAGAVILDSKRSVTAMIAPDTGAAPVAAAFDDFSADVPRAPPKPRS